MSDISAIGSKQAMFQNHAEKRSEHLQDVSAHLSAVSANLAARGKENASQNVANVAARVEARATNIQRAAQNHAADSLPPVVTDESGDGNGIADVTGKGTLLDATA